MKLVGERGSPSEGGGGGVRSFTGLQAGTCCQSPLLSLHPTHYLHPRSPSSTQCSHPSPTLRFTTCPPSAWPSHFLRAAIRLWEVVNGGECIRNAQTQYWQRWYTCVGVTWTTRWLRHQPSVTLDLKAQAVCRWTGSRASEEHYMTHVAMKTRKAEARLDNNQMQE